MGALKYLFSFKGRINRAKMWLFVLICFIVGIVLAFMDPESVEDMSGMSLVPVIAQGNAAVVAALSGVVAIVNLLLFVASIALAVKRLHDRNKGAIWLLVFYGIPLLCIIAMVAVAGVGFVKSPGAFKFEDWMVAPIAVACVVLAVVGIWSFIEFYCLRGTDGDNRFGPDPLAKG